MFRPSSQRTPSSRIGRTVHINERISKAKVMRTCSLFLATWLVRTPWADAQEAKMLSAGDARALVNAGLPAKAKRLPGIYAEGGKVVEKGRCMPFDVLWANPGPGSVHFDFYTVDLKTGALWRGIYLKPVTTPILVRMQRTLQRKMGVTEAEFQNAVEENVCSR